MRETPIYNINSTTLTKHRRAANSAGSVMSLSRAERIAYANAVEKTVLASQRSQLRGAGEPEARCPCPSGTWHSDGDRIAEAIRAQHRARLQRLADKDRRHTPEQWAEMYAKAMREKHAAQTPKE